MNGPPYLNGAAIICNLGSGIATVASNLFRDVPLANGSGFLTATDRYSPGQVLPLGLVNQSLPAVAPALEDTRNNRLLAATASQLATQIDDLKARFGPRRIGLVVGTSTSGIAEGEAALTHSDGGFQLAPGYSYQSQEFSSPARFLSRWLGIGGPAWVVSTACTSGGKALASAARLLNLGVCDAVIAGGVDTLCRMTVAGFSSLMVTSDTPCLPFSANRAGINIGEGAALFVLSREPGPIRLAGVGESSDAHHISSPDPEGNGAQLAMTRALASAGLRPEDIGYINLHGTATEQNDRMEATVVNRLFGTIPCSSTKGLTGHTLAAAGAIESLFCWLALQRADGRLPPHVWDGAADPALAPLPSLGLASAPASLKYAMSNSFAFGGNNLSLIFARE